MEMLLIIFFTGLLASMFATEDLPSFWAFWIGFTLVAIPLSASIKILVGG